MYTFHAGFEPGQPPVRVRIGADLRREVGAEMAPLGLSRALAQGPARSGAL